MWNPFNRKKTVPPPVTDTEIASAKTYLNGNIGFDIDEFFAEQSVESAMNTPLGDTPDCLSAIEVARIVEDNLITPEGQAHLYGCGECRSAVETYQAVCAMEFDLEFTGLSIAASERIRIPAHGPFYIDLFNRSDRPVLKMMDPKSIRINGVVVGSECHIKQLDPSPYAAKEAVRVQFTKYELQFPKGMDATCDFIELMAESNGKPLSARKLVCMRQD
jgi:hypothetical protein